MASKTVLPLKLLAMAPAMACMLDQIDDVFAPGGEKEADVLEATNAAYDVLLAIYPELEKFPKEALLQIVSGFHTMICGLLDLQLAIALEPLDSGASLGAEPGDSADQREAAAAVRRTREEAV